MRRTGVFAEEQLRAPFTLALLVIIPALFVVSAAGTLSDFADALGGSLAGDAAVALSAGWAAAPRDGRRDRRRRGRRCSGRDASGCSRRRR